MFIAESRDDRVLAVKPMNCPGHVLIFRDRLRSYRDLPLRLAEFGSCHRNEPSGALHGIMRVRAFTQDDAHIFCTEDQITAESVAFCELLLSVYKRFRLRGRGDQIRRPADRCAPAATRSGTAPKQSLKDAVAAAGLAYTLNPGEGAFYGPKLEFDLRDALGRDWQCGTLQLDFIMPERLARLLCRRGWRAPCPGHAAPRDLRLDGALYRHPDRALCRTLPAVAGAGAGCRRLDHLRGDDYAAEVARECAAAGLRAVLDNGNEKINYKVREHSLEKVPVMLVVGRREAENRAVALRRLGGNAQEALALGEAVARLKEEAAVPPFP